MTDTDTIKIELYKKQEKKVADGRDALLGDFSDRLVKRLKVLFEQADMEEKKTYSFSFGYWLCYAASDKGVKTFFETDAEIVRLRKALLEVGGWEHARSAVNEAFDRAGYGTITINYGITATMSY